MGRPKGSKNKPKIAPGAPVADLVAPTPTNIPPEPPKRRGRQPGSKNKPKEGVPPRPNDDPDDPPRVQAYTPEQIAEMYKGTPLAKATPAPAPTPSPQAVVVATNDPQHPLKVIGETPASLGTPIPETETALPPVPPKPAVPLKSKEFSKYEPLLECVEWLDSQMSEQWKFHYDMLGIKDGKNRKQAILYFIGCSFGMNTGLLEQIGSKLKK